MTSCGLLPLDQEHTFNIMKYSHILIIMTKHFNKIYWVLRSQATCPMFYRPHLTYYETILWGRFCYYLNFIKEETKIWRNYLCGQYHKPVRGRTEIQIQLILIKVSASYITLNASLLQDCWMKNCCVVWVLKVTTCQ